LSIVTPAFNEEANLPEFVQAIEAVGEQLRPSGLDLEIVIVDDHSGDATPAVAQRLLAGHANLRYLRLSRNSGAHAASSAGLQCCSGDAAVIMAADLQDPPEIIPALVRAWKEGNDVVWACRAERIGESWSTLAASRLYYRLMRVLALPQMPAKGADFVLIDRKVIDALNGIGEKHTSLLGMILWLGFRQTSLEYAKQARRAGRSKWTLSKKIKLFVDSVVSFSYAPIRIMSLFGFLMAGAGFLYALSVIIGRLGGWVTAGIGFAALMTVLLVGQGAILVMLGILGEYLWRTFDEARGRPRYIIEERRASAAPPSTSLPAEKETET
jgi:dolichol-phosphate mannosyltransferase